MNKETPAASFTRWNRIAGPDPSDDVLTYAWSLMTGEAREFWAAVDSAFAAAREPRAVTGTPGRPTTSLEDSLLRNIDGLNGLVRDILQADGETTGLHEWRDRAGRLHVCDPDGQPYRAWTEDEEDEMRRADMRGPSPAWVTDAAAGLGSVSIGSPEDGDYDGRHPDGCPCQFCREDERDAARDDDEADPWDNSGRPATQDIL